MIAHGLIRSFCSVVALTACFASCSSDSKSSDAVATVADVTTTTTGTTVDVSVAPSTPASTSASSVAPTTGGSSSDATAEITAAFTTFFDGVDPDIDRKIAVLEHGEQLRQMIVDASADPQFQQLTTTVNSITVLPDSDCVTASEVAPCAGVVHDMFVGGLPAMVGLQSHAVKIDGVWKVSAKSWCAIVEIGGATCPALTEG